MAKKGDKFKNYSPEFKLQVVEDDLSEKICLKSDNQVFTWTRKYRENPLLLHQGLIGSEKAGRSKINHFDKVTTEEEQNTFLRMENDILKTLRTLLKRRE
ncbi:transposase [Streptococcus pyogenes]|uniref:transposase n=2 Tax=Streptococcus pyogenes TaxID=1314 RepID=UPI0010A0D7C2|nr:transposase [Streptococcus pyogenes]VGR62057.1 transposase [Streptococcus pyogenes]VGU39598.1 transposase [Streptococcus pyogenes]VHE89484.1 transposase [Streptococcus pyogenes]VHE94857.1 transposase [Streptococcus pyogenes]VHG14522.1 transposase [Streptococcus pyogenes]